MGANQPMLGVVAEVQAADPPSNFEPETPPSTQLPNPHSRAEHQPCKKSKGSDLQDQSIGMVDLADAIKREDCQQKLRIIPYCGVLRHPPSGRKGEERADGLGGGVGGIVARGAETPRRVVWDGILRTLGGHLSRRRTYPVAVGGGELESG